MIPDYKDPLWGTQDEDGKNWANFNLDYFLITSELYNLENMLNSEHSPTEELFNVELNIGSKDHSKLYDAYKTHTLSFLEQEVESRSMGRFDSIRPTVINGVPQYMFVDSQDETTSRTQSLSPLYSPIIVSQTRYNELLREGKYSDSVIKVQVDCAYGFENDVFNAYQLHPAEALKYSAKIPLSSAKEFNYPITSITIEVKGILGTTEKSVDVDPSDYTVVDGNLYFAKTLEEIAFINKAELFNIRLSISMISGITKKDVIKYGRI